MGRPITDPAEARFEEWRRAFAHEMAAVYEALGKALEIVREVRWQSHFDCDFAADLEPLVRRAVDEAEGLCAD
jgi:hypothetical protein